MHLVTLNYWSQPTGHRQQLLITISCFLYIYFFFTNIHYTHEYKRNKYQNKRGKDRAVTRKTEQENNNLRNI